MAYRILVIDDNDFQSKIIERMLDSENYDCVVDSVTSIKEAKDFINNLAYDLYVVDIYFDNEEELGIDLIGRGIVPNKAIVLSSMPTETQVRDLVDRFKVPRKQIMTKPIPKEYFYELLNEMGFVKRDNINSGKNKESNDVVSSLCVFASENWKKISNMTFKKFLLYLTLVLSIPIIISSSHNLAVYKHHNQFNENVKKYAETRFKDYRKGGSVTSRRFVTDNIIIDKYEFEIRVYPDDFIFVLVSCINNECEPTRYWFPGIKYIQGEGLDKDKTFLDVIFGVWKNSKSVTGLK